jgi:hypothetical protein
MVDDNCQYILPRCLAGGRREPPQKPAYLLYMLYYLIAFPNRPTHSAAIYMYGVT